MGNDKKENNEKPKVHKDLEGLDITINSFGEIVGNFDIDKVNKFLDDSVEDKKLTERDGKYSENKKKEK